MSSYHPHPFPTSFTSLLGSQQESNIPGSPSTPIHLGSQPVHLVEETSPETVRGPRIRWSVGEDLILISAWLNTSKDPIVGNEQRAGCFWKRIAAYFSACEGGNINHRGPTHCKQRWRKINESVNKFVGCYTLASGRRKSGQSEDDVLKMAHDLYTSEGKGKFMLDHCWRELRNDQKWCTAQGLTDKDSSKRSRADGDASSTSAGDTVNARPKGVKAAKRAAKGRGKKKAVVDEEVACVELDKLAAMRERDLEGKDRLANKKVLDTLLRKSDLTEDELQLKNYLVQQMLGRF